MVHVAHFLHLVDVDLSDHLIDVFCCQNNLGSPFFVDEPIDFKLLEYIAIQQGSLFIYSIELCNKFANTVKLVVLLFEVYVHHFCNKGQSLFHQSHELVLHRLILQSAEVPFDQECIELQLHALVWLVSIMLEHVLEQVFKIEGEFIPIYI